MFERVPEGRGVLDRQPDDQRDHDHPRGQPAVGDPGDVAPLRCGERGHAAAVPSARCMIASGPIASPASSPATAPPRQTSTRCESPTTSGRSLEANTTAIPSRPVRARARRSRLWRRRRCRASARRAAAPAAAFAATWPARPSAGCRPRARRSPGPGRSPGSRAAPAPVRTPPAPVRGRSTRGASPSAGRPASCSRAPGAAARALRPCAPPGTSTTPAPTRARSDPPDGAPADASPPRPRRAPARRRSSRLRPEPTSPASPTISPARTRSAPASSTTSAPAGRQRREHRVDVAADHLAHEPRHVELRDRPVGDVAPVAEHGDVVGQLDHLVEQVADVEHGHVVGGQRAHDREDRLALLAGQHRGRLVEDQHARAPHERPRDLHQLAGAEREPLGWRVQIQPLEAGARTAPRAPEHAARDPRAARAASAPGRAARCPPPASRAARSAPDRRR